MIHAVRRQAAGLDLRFLTSTTVLTVGIALARLLGFGFSLILARRLSPESYGFVQYTITLAGIVAIGTQPFVQHVLARFIGKYTNDQEQLNQYLHTVWVILIGLTALTVLVAVPMLGLSGRLSLGVMVIFLGMTLFYGYYGLARGFMSSYRLLGAYLGSNLVQVIAIFLVYYLTDTQATLPALLIYGLSYLIPIALLQAFSPLPVRFRFALPPRDKTMELLRFSIPVWISHAAYIFYAGIDVLMLERFLGTEAVGVYALSKTLSMLLSFVPAALITVLLPKAAAMPREQHGRLLRQMIMFTVLANAPFVVAYLAGYGWFVSTVFNHDYVVGFDVILMLALAEVLFGIHGVITSIVVGGNRPQLETYSRVLIVATAIVAGSLLIPTYGISGAAFTFLLGAIISNLSYGAVALFERRRHASVQP